MYSNNSNLIFFYLMIHIWLFASTIYYISVLRGKEWKVRRNDDRRYRLSNYDTSIIVTNGMIIPPSLTKEVNKHLTMKITNNSDNLLANTPSYILYMANVHT